MQLGVTVNSKERLCRGCLCTGEVNTNTQGICDMQDQQAVQKQNATTGEADSSELKTNLAEKKCYCGITGLADWQCGMQCVQVEELASLRVDSIYTLYPFCPRTIEKLSLSFVFAVSNQLEIFCRMFFTNRYTCLTVAHTDCAEH